MLTGICDVDVALGDNLETVLTEALVCCYIFILISFVLGCRTVS
jgi:hypothetical protein